MENKKGLQIKYFVLNPKPKFSGDPYAEASRLAMAEYARKIQHIDKRLSEDLLNWVHKEYLTNQEHQSCKDKDRYKISKLKNIFDDLQEKLSLCADEKEMIKEYQKFYLEIKKLLLDATAEMPEEEK